MSGVGTGGVRARCKKCNRHLQPVPDGSKGYCPPCKKDADDIQLYIDTVKKINESDRRDVSKGGIP